MVQLVAEQQRRHDHQRREQPIRRHDPDDATLQEASDLACLPEAIATYVIHHESADDEEDIDASPQSIGVNSLKFWPLAV